MFPVGVDTCASCLETKPRDKSNSLYYQMPFFAGSHVFLGKKWAWYCSPCYAKLEAFLVSQDRDWTTAKWPGDYDVYPLCECGHNYEVHSHNNKAYCEARVHYQLTVCKCMWYTPIEAVV